MVVVVVAVVVFVFVFSAAVYTNLRLSASKPISMCTKKIRLFATVYSNVFVWADNVPTSRPYVWPLENIYVGSFSLWICRIVFDSAVRGNRISVEYGFVTLVANPNYLCVFIFIKKIKVSIHKTNIFKFCKLCFLIDVAKCNHRNTSAWAGLENIIVVLPITR